MKFMGRCWAREGAAVTAKRASAEVKEEIRERMIVLLVEVFLTGGGGQDRETDAADRSPLWGLTSNPAQTATFERTQQARIHGVQSERETPF